MRDGPFDGIASVGMFEHVGSSKSAEYFGAMRRLLEPEGRLLNHAISSVGGSRIGPQILHRSLRLPRRRALDVGRVVLAMEERGVRGPRRRVLSASTTPRRSGPGSATSSGIGMPAVAEVGVRRARVWLLYMAASANGFEDGGISIHQVLGVVPGPDGRSGMPPTRGAWG